MIRFVATIGTVAAFAFAAPASAQMRITEWMYSGATTEYIEFTNVGTASVDMTGWSFDDDGRVPGATLLTDFGVVRAGESVLLVEGDAETFRTAWGLCAAQKIIGGNANNLGRNDEINLYDAASAQIDRLTYGDQNIAGSIRTQNAGGWVSTAGLGANNVLLWTLSTVGDAEGSTAPAGDIGSPGRSTRASVPFDPCVTLGPMMRITEYMYDGAPGEFVEFTNVGDAPANLAGWGFDDDDATLGRVDISAFGEVQPGESVILTEADATAFRSAWNLCAGVKVIGGLTQNLGRNDAIHLTDATPAAIDDLDFGDTQFPGTIRTTNASGWVTAAGVGADDPAAWVLSTVGDAEGSLANTASVPGSPGRSTRATTTFDPCASTPGAPTISVDPAATTDLLDLPVNVGGALSGVIGDATDPAATLGITFTLADDNGAAALIVTANSSNTSVVPNTASNLDLSGTGDTRMLRIVPTGVGYSSITVSVRDAGNLLGTYVLSYAASAASATPTTTRFHTGASDGSAAVAIDAQTMLVADDEDQALRLYARDVSGLFVAAFDMTATLGVGDEVDIESSTRSAARVYWSGSHGNDKDGDLAPDRRRLFATDLSGTGLGASATYVDRYDFLRDDLFAWDAANGHGLGANALGFVASGASGVRPDVANGFNIEGLTLAPDGTSGWLAFRAPLLPTAARTQALIVPVANLDTLVVDGASGSRPAGSAVFGTPILLDLGGRAIRSIERASAGGYLIVAGPPGADTGVPPADFRLYTWSGASADAPHEVTTVNLTALATGGSVEGLLDVSATSGADATFQLVIDNGDAVFYGDGIIGKDLSERRFAKFRSEHVSADLRETLFVDGFEDVTP